MLNEEYYILNDNRITQQFTINKAVVIVSYAV